MKCLILSFAIAAVLVSLASAGTVVIGGRCLDCSPPVGEKVIVDGQVHSRGKPGQGTVYINSPGAYPGALDGPARGPPRKIASGADGTRYPEGFSGRVPGNTYLHNTDCVGCSISGGGD
ncbi:bomanin Bicipital 1 [Drosophila kikkawai]|uniref:Bomanin Bicipital 1 n=1 Tax=Drosophila kikkawai TaxID=30033 RepID=A0A6P4IRC3_DROKI|nr:bomanin Bicipital 1 [Drosophila kikkawai]